MNFVFPKEVEKEPDFHPSFYTAVSNLKGTRDRFHGIQLRSGRDDFAPGSSPFRIQGNPKEKRRRRLI